jgi:DNA-binding FadR family transcriptional regulator
MAIYEFLAVGNAEKAAAAMERHLVSTEFRFLKRMENNGI